MTWSGNVPYRIIENTDSDAPWIAMIHGVSQNQRLFNRQISTFSTTHQIILIDLPDHGSASDIAGPYGVTEFSEHLEQCFARAKIGPCHFWGTHFGASSGLILACKKPSIFKNLILEGPIYPGQAIPAVAKFIERTSETARAQGIEAARKLW